MNSVQKIMTATLFSLTLLGQLCATTYSNQEVELFLDDMPNFENLLKNKTVQSHAETEDGRSLLIAAIEAGNLEAVKLLIKYNANPNQGTDAAGQPPLHCAIWNFQINIVDFLLKYISNIHQQDDDGVLPLSTAAQGGRLINDIDDRTITEQDLQHYIPICKSIITLLIKNGANINAKNKAGDTALHCAVCWGLSELVQTLLELGADKSITDQKGRTPLACAIDHEYEKIIKILS